MAPFPPAPWHEPIVPQTQRGLLTKTWKRATRQITLHRTKLTASAAITAIWKYPHSKTQHRINGSTPDLSDSTWSL